MTGTMKTYHPVSTYRLQFNGDFTLKDSERILGYLHKLGIRTIYASPLFRAVRGSTHGYDVTDPLSLNPEIGTEREFEKLTEKVRRMRMGWLQDIVPNHMAYSTENPWIRDVLVHGKESEYHKVFDIVSEHPDSEMREKLMLPFFGKSLEGLIRDGELKLKFGKQGFDLVYYEQEYPVSRRAYSHILEACGIADRLSGPDGLEEISGEFALDPEFARHMEQCTETINRDPDRMGSLTDRLCYLPAHWKETEKRINYRRFFTINGLICVNSHLAEVFDRTHGLIRSWVEKGVVDGLRIDHVDGLYDPSGYLDQLREMCGGQTYIVAEKILEKEETIPGSWPVQGTTGYDFLASVNQLLTNISNGSFFYDYYGEWTGKKEDPEQVFLEKKSFILLNRLGGELELLTHQCLSAVAPAESAGTPPHTKVEHEEMRKAVAAFMIHFPVYRSYNAPSSFTKKEKESVRKTFSRARSDDPGNNKALTLLERMILFKDAAEDAQRIRIDGFFRRMMQFTGPLMAKGIEDTAFYTFHPFIAHNEVGDSPSYFGIGTDAFHRQMTARRENHPMTLNALSTHDTKRGEDARARLNVLSDIPEQWKKITTRWRRMNKGLKKTIHGTEIPAAADEYLIYQSLCAHFPMDNRLDDNFINRFGDYLVKALREGKERSSWSDPDMDYENHTLAFVSQILDPSHQFLESIMDFLTLIIPHGIINSITQTILRNTVPGVPDTFQGCETWNLSFVDPDNRRPVDFRRLSKDLDKMIRASAADPRSHLNALRNKAEDGRIKQWISHLTLQERAAHPELFLKGSYIPLRVTGRFRNHVLAFCRSYRDEHLIVAVPLHTASMQEGQDWKETRIRLPELVPFTWEHRFTRESITGNGYLRVREIFQDAPFAILRGIPNQPEKRAGILMHISSLPGGFGTGDFGPGACGFIDFLQRAGQRIWQILPLSATGRDSGYSPYSSRSAFAGNVLFIDPYQLVEEGLLGKRDLDAVRGKSGESADYPGAEKAKMQFLHSAFRSFQKSGKPVLKKRLDAFREQEKYWLEDFALYEALKRHFSGQPWYAWPEKYRDRHNGALEEYRRKNHNLVEQIIFEQFMFSEQWDRLKTYANDSGVDIFGDIPIYVDHDSADTWAHPELFKLNPDKSMRTVAGVPPDYFNRDGQLWGMPVYDWEAMDREDNDWWLRRIEKNLQWFNLVRLDHFRGFSAYWEVPAGSATALEGQWTRGPGRKLFNDIKDRYPDMPLVAEDLGQIDREVYELRDLYGLPGMKVVQFGFGSRMPFSHHFPGNIPYNSIVYTGTHDNNTMKGWFRKEADRATLKRFKTFSGIRLTEKNVHREMIRVAYASPAKTVIIPMQDWLGLDEKSRMNFPSTTDGNWLWRVKDEHLNSSVEKKIRKKVRQFGRF